MAKPSDREYALQRKIKDLEAKNAQLEERLSQLNKKIEKMELSEVSPKAKKKAPIKEQVCPTCEASIKVSELPFGQMKLCSAGCGWREVKGK
jgi:predicted nuclease with TOPRIM domain